MNFTPFLKFTKKYNLHTILFGVMGMLTFLTCFAVFLNIQQEFEIDELKAQAHTLEVDQLAIKQTLERQQTYIDAYEADKIHALGEKDLTIATLNQLLDEAAEDKTQSYLKSIGTFTATYYTQGESGVGDVTATGTKVEAGRTLAVDPTVIPYGTQVYIKNMGWYTAEDCGGAIKGNRVDIYVDSLSDIPSVGKHPVELYVSAPLSELKD